MKIENIDVSKNIKFAQELIEADKTISPAVKAVIELLITIINLFVAKFLLNSKNSSKPPSADQNREKKPKSKTCKKPGGQNGHKGTNLQMVDNPDKIVELTIDQKTLPKGSYIEIGFERRQIIDIHISKLITEYRAQILQNASGTKYTAAFPDKVPYKVQYGASVKAQSVYMYGFQMIPYNRIVNYFADQAGIALSPGSIFNFNQEAYDKLELFEEIVKDKLVGSEVINADETGINVGGKRKWLHLASNDLWAYFYPHDKRGGKAMDEAGILPSFTGILCHDHWSSYYTYTGCVHSLCNAHHLRELQNVIDVNNHKWAKDMQDLLCEINTKVEEAGGFVPKERADEYRERYRAILSAGDLESPAPEPPKEGEKKKKGRVKKAKHRNLLERLRNFEDDVLRFMENILVPFTNNAGENDLRMVKVQQKISGCFRSEQGAKIFCRIRSYILTCQKHNMPATEALNILFSGKLPDFCHQSGE